MQKIKMSRGVTLTFEEGCKRYLENCRQRNLREGTIGHYYTIKLYTISLHYLYTMLLYYTAYLPPQ